MFFPFICCSNDKISFIITEEKKLREIAKNGTNANEESTNEEFRKKH